MKEEQEWEEEKRKEKNERGRISKKWGRKGEN